MRLMVISHKECWSSPNSPSGYATVGGFPFQMEHLSALFDATTLVLPLQYTPLPEGATPLIGKNLSVSPLQRQLGSGLQRRLVSLTLIPRLWQEVRSADAVHTPIPGDIGTLGLLIALIQRKPLFVRHCGTWGSTSTLANRFLTWLLPRIAGGRNVVMATGGADTPPCPGNPHVTWIFSTTLTEREINTLPAAKPWRHGMTLRLITVARLSEAKNVQAAIRALPLIRQQYPDVHYSIAGDGPYRGALEQLVADLGLTSAVTLHGNVPHHEVLRLLAASHIFVFPSVVEEGFPKAVLEALACGLPVVATSVSVLPWLIGGHASGVILSDAEPQTIARAIVQMISDEQWIAVTAHKACQAARAYSLEKWRDVIGDRLRSAWGELSNAG